MSVEKTKAAAPGKGAALQNLLHEDHTAKSAQTDSKILKSRSTSTETQCAKLVVLLRMGPQTTYSLRKHGIGHPGGRIENLRDSGYTIITDRVEAVDSDGFLHFGVARYTLLQEPLPQLAS
jgi:hypothetical protein